MQSLIYFLVVAALFLFMMRFGCGAHVMGHGHHHGRSSRSGDGGQPPARATDPICGMTVETASAKSSFYQGQAYYFCSTACRDKFEASPQAFAKGAEGSSQMKEMEHGGHH